MSSNDRASDVAGQEHRAQIKAILRDAFADNKSVNWAIRSRAENIDTLLDYSLGMAQRFGAIQMDCAGESAVVYLLPDRKKFSWFELFASVRMLRASGIKRSIELLQREKYIHARHPQNRTYIYLWYIGVQSGAQGQGCGTRALEEIKALSRDRQWPIYLETSTDRNRGLYERCQFELYHTWNNGIMGFPLYFYRYHPGKG